MLITPLSIKPIKSGASFMSPPMVDMFLLNSTDAAYTLVGCFLLLGIHLLRVLVQMSIGILELK